MVTCDWGLYRGKWLLWFKKSNKSFFSLQAVQHCAALNLESKWEKTVGFPPFTFCAFMLSSSLIIWHAGFKTCNVLTACGVTISTIICQIKRMLLYGEVSTRTPMGKAENSFTILMSSLIGVIYGSIVYSTCTHSTFSPGMAVIFLQQDKWPSLIRFYTVEVM